MPKTKGKKAQPGRTYTEAEVRDLLRVQMATHKMVALVESYLRNRAASRGAQTMKEVSVNPITPQDIAEIQLFQAQVARGQSVTLTPTLATKLFLLAQDAMMTGGLYNEEQGIRRPLQAPIGPGGSNWPAAGGNGYKLDFVRTLRTHALALEQAGNTVKDVVSTIVNIWPDVAHELPARFLPPTPYTEGKSAFGPRS